MAQELSGLLSANSVQNSTTATLWANQYAMFGGMSALAFIDQMQTTMEKQEEKLRKIGSTAGKPIGEEIAKAIEEAIRNAIQTGKAAGARSDAATVSTYSTVPPINVTVNGAIDPVGVARQIERILTTGRLRGGRGV